MSGHSKWSQIKRQKGAADIKRGQIFTKLANAITIAVRQGGGVTDPESNFKLRLAIEKARAANMPKENVERALRRAQGKPGEGVLEEVVYEGFGPERISVIVECVTDNKQRTFSEIKSVFDKSGGRLGQPGSVSHQFTQVGTITVKKDMAFEDVFAKAAEAGAEDVEEAGSEVLIYTEPGRLSVIKDKLTQAGLTIIEAELSRKPMVTVPITDKETVGKILSFMDMLESLDSVQKVYSNFDISDEILNSKKESVRH